MSRLRLYGIDFVLLVSALEAALVPLALLLGWLLGIPLRGTLDLAPSSLAIALLATVPLWWLLRQLHRIESAALRELFQWIQGQVRTMFAGASTLQLALISLLAGLGEELLFRGVLQPALQMASGGLAGLLLASLLFGVAHWLNAAYVIFAFLMGLYLGAMYWMTENLVVPIIIHGAYDFLALRMLLDRPAGGGSLRAGR